MSTVTHRPVLVVDFGAQYAQLIARRVREARVYSEIVPSTMPVAEMLAKDPVAVILSGGPSSVYADGAPMVDAELFGTGVPTFGICYGFQAMALALGGEVARTGLSEFGRTPLTVTEPGSAIFSGLPTESSVWMSHGDAVHRAPEGFTVVCRARLIHVNGVILTFQIDAHDGVDPIARGLHKRAVIDVDRFSRRIEKKRKGHAK